MSITYAECVSVVLAVQHAKRVLFIIFSFAACSAIPYFFKLSHKRYDFRENISEHKICALMFSITYV
jgi:hypothetical protein